MFEKDGVLVLIVTFCLFVRVMAVSTPENLKHFVKEINIVLLILPDMMGHSFVFISSCYIFNVIYSGMLSLPNGH